MTIAKLFKIMLFRVKFTEVRNCPFILPALWIYVRSFPVWKSAKVSKEYSEKNYQKKTKKNIITNFNTWDNCTDIINKFFIDLWSKFSILNLKGMAQFWLSISWLVPLGKNSFFNYLIFNSPMFSTCPLVISVGIYQIWWKFLEA